MKHFEFWNPRLFELPYYLYLLLGASIRGLSIGRYLLDAAYEHRHQPMKLDSYRSIIKKVRENARVLNVSHKQLMEGSD